MHYTTALGLLGVATAAAILFWSTSDQTTTPKTSNAETAILATPPPPPQDRGHLILLIEGDARTLKATHVFSKPSPYNPIRVKTDYEVVVFDSNHRELGRYPMDLANFDLDPSNIGKPDEVAPLVGDQITQRKVEALVNIPDLKDASFLVFEKNRLPVGEVLPREFAHLKEAN